MKAVRYDGFGGIDVLRVEEEAGAGAGGFCPGDEVIGFSNKRASQAELVLVEAGDLARKPEKVSWEVAGGLYVAGVTAWGAVHAVQPEEGETVVISGAAGGSARSPSSSRAVPGPRSSGLRAPVSWVPGASGGGGPVSATIPKPPPALRL